MKTLEPIDNHKAFCRDLCEGTGWTYGGWFDGNYMFQTGDYLNGFKEMLLWNEDLTKENFLLMVKLGSTRVERNNFKR